MSTRQKRDEYISRVISRLVKGLKENYQPEKIILYGSYAYGTPDEASDIDLLIIKKTNERPIDRRIAVRRLVSDIRRKIPFSSLVLTPEELADRLGIGDDFFIEITNKGRVLYER
ncbi:MAG: nucleotidyltransferase domain-containing protein [Deltaproteobacteria bacterium]|nr:nucleotidyltransferase domain-containing protein [Deltaproteobacteria bacterium]